MSWDVVMISTKTNLHTRLIDCSTGEFISPDKPTSFAEWKAYRDKIVNGQLSK